MSAPAANSGRLPPTIPQAPTSSRLPPSNGGGGGNGVPHSNSKSSRSGKKGSSSSGGGRRARSSSDGVRAMNERQYHPHHQQQQQQQQYQQYYGGGGYGGGQGNYPAQQYHNNAMQGGGAGGPSPPPPGFYMPSAPPTPPSAHGRPSSHRSLSERPPRGGPSPFDAGPPPPPPLMGGGGGGYGSIQSSGSNLSSSSGGGGKPPSHVRSRSRTGSREFSAMNELSSIIGGGSGGGGGAQRSSPSPRSSNRGSHRRTMSDSGAMQQQYHHQGSGSGQWQQQHQRASLNNPVVMPNPNYQNGTAGGYGALRGRTDSHDSHGSQRSYYSAQQQQHNMGVWHGGDLGGEAEAFFAQHLGGGGGNGNKQSSSRPKTHMRQNSVNLYMKSFKGQAQPRACRDALYALLYFLQLVCVCIVGLRFGPDALVETDDELGPTGGEDDAVPVIDAIDDSKVVLAHRAIMRMAYTCGAFALVVSALALAFMMAMSRRLVYVALVLSIGVSFAWGTIGVGISPKSFVPVTGIIALMLTVGYMFVVWDRIPFASANLTAALTGVRDNLALVGVAFFFQVVALVASIYYSFTFVGLHDAMLDGQMSGLSDNAKVAVDVLLFLSYYWTYQVIRHIVMVTVAGTIGSWWFNKPSAIKETFLRATVYNFGSICYGSLFVGFVQLLRQITEGLRPNHDDSAMMCLYECSVFLREKVVSCVDNLADSFTPWAFTYIGLYHYGLKDSGHKANELFERRGWSRIVTDDLISNVLTMVSLVIGGLSGSFAVILQALDGHGLTSFGHPVLVSFTIGFMVGIVNSTVLFSIIESSVCAVIVCFAGSPVEFHRNHRELDHEMRHAWKEVWPGSLDMGVSVGAGLA